MAKLTPTNKVKIFKQLNERALPWKNSRFVIKEDEYDWLGNGNFSEVYVMEDTINPSNSYAVKIIGFNEHRRIHQSDIESYKKEPILQYGLANQCSTVVKIIDTEVLSIKLDENGNVEDARLDDFGVEKVGWLVLVLIKMERLAAIIEQNFTGDYSFKIPALIYADDKEMLSLAINIAEALETSHSMSIMHRDVKLENIFFDEKSGSYKLGDFGIARITNQGSASTKGAGTLGYEAPEVEGGNDAKYSYQADIYSFGVTIYLLMNELRFPGSTGYHVNRNIQYNPNSTIDMPMHGSEEFKALICSLIRYNPSDRPKNMSDVLEGLDAIYTKKYGARESHKVVKKQHRVRDEVESIKTNISKTVTDVKHITEEVKEHKDVVGSVVAEVKRDIAPETKNTNNQEVLSNNPGKVESTVSKVNTVKGINPREGIFKGIIGGICILAGLLYFGILSGDSLNLIKTPMVLVSLIANSLVSLIAYYLKFVKKKKMPYLVYFILFAFSIFVMFTGGMSWFYLIISIGVFIGGVSEVLFLQLTAWIYLIFMMLSVVDKIPSDSIINLAWIFFALVLFGFILTEQYDKQDDLFAIILGNEASHYFIGFLLIIAGIVLFILNLIPAVDVATLLMKMHFIYVGLILWITGSIVNTIGRRTSY